jgi:hypothetical protein
MWVDFLKEQGTANLVDAIELGESIKDGVHGVEHRDDFHRTDSATDFCKCHHVAEQDRYTFKDLW